MKNMNAGRLRRLRAAVRLAQSDADKHPKNKGKQRALKDARRRLHCFEQWGYEDLKLVPLKELLLS